jgi:general nucleoside transport system permease protein
VIIVGEAPGATLLSLRGAFGDLEGVGYTLFFATDYVFAGLAVALPYRAGLSNIGSEGQAALGGLGATLVELALVRTRFGLRLWAAGAISLSLR